MNAQEIHNELAALANRCSDANVPHVLYHSILLDFAARDMGYRACASDASIETASAMINADLKFVRDRAVAHYNHAFSKGVKA